MEITTMEWVDWYDDRRLHSACGDRPPAEFETLYRTDNGLAILAGAG